MSVSTRKAVLLAVAFLLIAPVLFAANPSARTQSRMVYDAVTGNTMLFGGLAAYDSGTKLAYDLDDTWEWNGDHWFQVYPATVPGARSIHVMVYDSARRRTLMFGGKNGFTNLNDMWSYSRRQWTEITPTHLPPGRTFAGAAYDSDRDRVVLFGGSQNNSDGTVITNIYDTWEFDGTDWQQVNDNGPQFIKPILVYDKVRHQTLMFAEETTTLTPHMFEFDSSSHTWTEITGITLPTCVNDAVMQYQDSTQTVILTNGVCTSADSATYEWDGATWTKLAPTNAAPFTGGAAAAYDQMRQQILTFGGTVSSGEILAATYVFRDGNWIALGISPTPTARSLPVFRADPTNKFIYLFGGIDEFSSNTDMWKYVNGGWAQVTYDTSTGTLAPTTCLSPVSAFDTDRQKLVIVCNDSIVYEWDGAAWKKFDSLKTTPPTRRFSSMVYDPTLKKSVLFGGFDETNYVDETWTWDGATWTRVKNHPPTARSNASMWYDPTLKKTIVYGGIGRITIDDRTTRYADMWSFDGSGWTAMNITTTPGARYGAQLAVDPRNNHAYLFGGLAVHVDGTVQTQVYMNDTWEWDGAAWKQLTPANSPFARENGGFEFDPGLNELVLFGGYAGHYFSDLWVFDGTTWALRTQIPPPRRRAGR
ncbi:MAG: Kelch repeat-containing protein [Thermoanaerobaculia bacterium]